MQRYWLSRGEGEVIGPFTAEELADMNARGELDRATGQMPMVCAEGDAQWQAIAAMPELAWILGRDTASPVPALWPPPQAPGQDPLEGVPFSFDQAFGLGWRAFTSRYGLLLGATAITIGVSFGVSVTLSVLDQIAMASGGMAQIVLQIISLLVNLSVNLLVVGPLSAGCLWIAVRIVRGQGASLDALLHPFKRLVQLVLAGVIVSVLVVVSVIPGLLILILAAMMGGPGGGGGLAAGIFVGMALVLVPGIYVSTRLAPAYMMVIDPLAGPTGPMSPGEAIGASWTLTRGRVATLVGIAIVAGLIAAATVLACFLPYIFFGGPLYMAVLGAAYALLIATRPAGAGSGPGAL